MNKRATSASKLLPCVLLAVVAAAFLPQAGYAQTGDVTGDGKTEDVLHMNDGRVLRGQIVEEKKDAVVLEITDAATGIGGKITLLLEEIAEIERDVPAAGAEEKPARRAVKRGPTSRPTSRPEDPIETYGARRASSDKLDVPSFYLVPMKGQMGTDVSIDVYRKMVDDIREHDPDYIIIEMECQDTQDRVVDLSDQADRGLSDIGILENYKEVADLFRAELRDIDQVLFIRDSMGPSSIVALAWPDVYMSSGARLGGIDHVRRFFDVADENVKAKFREAYMALLNGFALHGGHSTELMHAMVRPEMMLSARWKGREVEWTLDTTGEYIVDDNDEECVTFYAKDAEDFCISDGTVENLDDLALLMGIREYRIVEGDGEKIFEDYREDWRTALENCKTWWADYQQYMGWASGDDTLKYLGRAKRTVEKMLSKMEQYKAVEMRVRMELGLRTFDLVTIIEQLKERITALRAGGRVGGGVGGGGTGRGGG